MDSDEWAKLLSLGGKPSAAACAAALSGFMYGSRGPGPVVEEEEEDDDYDSNNRYEPYHRRHRTRTPSPPRYCGRPSSREAWLQCYGKDDPHCSGRLAALPADGDVRSRAAAAATADTFAAAPMWLPDAGTSVESRVTWLCGLETLSSAHVSWLVQQAGTCTVAVVPVTAVLRQARAALRCLLNAALASAEVCRCLSSMSGANLEFWAMVLVRDDDMAPGLCALLAGLPRALPGCSSAFAKVLSSSIGKGVLGCTGPLLALHSVWTQPWRATLEGHGAAVAVMDALLPFVETWVGDMERSHVVMIAQVLEAIVCVDGMTCEGRWRRFCDCIVFCSARHVVPVHEVLQWMGHAL